MNNFNDNKNDMSMEDILASIRKYVAEDDNKQTSETDSGNHASENLPNSESSDSIIRLNESQIATPEGEIQESQENLVKNNENKNYNSETYSEVSTLSMNTVDTSTSSKESPFNKLANALNTYGKNKTQNKKDTTQEILTIDKFLKNLATPIIEKWVSNNISKIVEEVVDREIQKLKNNN